MATTGSGASPRSRLAACRAEVQAIILSRQNPQSGLLPASTAVTVHGDYTHAWVRDNVYSILAVWALALASSRVDPEAAPALEDAVVRLMRGLLGTMIRQAPKVERFKHTQHPLDALHAKYDTATGESVVGDADWGHLQIDATALFVLWLVRMSSGGLAIVRDDAELAFVQNLVHYLAKAYRTPDYGIWERGHKRNEGLAEINASSVGMAKAALQAVDGFRFLPSPAPAVHVVADDTAHARDALDGLLPRESPSKETDAALLSVVGFPACAVEDPALAARTRGLIISKLEGRYGCKRFLLALQDGLHQGVTVVPLDKAWASGEVTTIDWLADLPGGQTALAMPSGLGAALEWDEAATRPLTAARAALLEHETDSGALMAQLSGSRNPYEQIELLSLLWGRHGPEMQLQLGGSVRDMVAAVYAHASRLRLWGVLRRAAALLELVDRTVEHAMAHLVVHQRRVLLGREAHPEATVSRPCSHLDIAERLRRFGGDDVRARLLIQEAVLLQGTLVKAEPALFKDTLTLRPWQLVLLVNGWLAREHGITPAEAFDHLLGLSPSAILGRLREVIAREKAMQNNLLGLQLLRCLPGPSQLQDLRFTAENDPPLAGIEGGWRAWREATGVMTRAQGDFHAHVRTLMQHCEGIVAGEPLDARNRLDSATLLADTTPDEPAFAHGVEDLLDKIEDAAYRQLTIEALSAAAVFCAANPGLKINGQLVADALLATAVACATGDAQAAEHVAAGVAAGVDGLEGGWAEAWQDFYASPPHRVAGFVIDAFKLLLRRTAA